MTASVSPEPYREADPPRDAGPPRGCAGGLSQRALVGVIAVMGVLAVAWLSYQSWRYFSVPKELGGRRIAQGAIDLRNRVHEVRAWFRGENVYAIYSDAVYPPATYALLGLVFNRLRWQVIKLLWYLASLVAVGVMSWQACRLSLATSRAERVFVALIPFTCYATGAALGNGQLVVFVLPLILGAVLLLARCRVGDGAAWCGALAMLFALVQPTIAAPFFWLLLFVVPRLKPAILVVSMYLFATAFASYFQIGATIPITLVAKVRAIEQVRATEQVEASETGPTERAVRSPQTASGFGRLDGPMSILNTWSERAAAGAYQGSLRGGYGNVHALLAALRLSRWNWPVSVAILLLLGGWVFANRHADLWLLLGVTAIVARTWTYHRWYDDLLLIVPLISLFRMTKLSCYGPRVRTLAAGLFAWIGLFLLPPGVLYALPSLGVLVGIQVAGWIATLIFLTDRVRRNRVALPRACPG